MAFRVYWLPPVEDIGQTPQWEALQFEDGVTYSILRGGVLLIDQSAIGGEYLTLLPWRWQWVRSSNEAPGS